MTSADIIYLVICVVGFAAFSAMLAYRSYTH